MVCFHKLIEKIVFFLQIRIVSKNVTKNKTNETIKQELLDSLQENDDVEEQGLNKTVNNVNKSREAMLIINSYKDHY